jgi:hypothetical protein
LSHLGLEIGDNDTNVPVVGALLQEAVKRRGGTSIEIVMPSA